MYSRRAPRHLRGTPRSSRQRRSARPQIRCVPSTIPSLTHTGNSLHRQCCDPQGRQGVRLHRCGPRTRDPGRTYARGALARIRTDRQDTRGSCCTARTGSVYIDPVIPRGSSALVRTIQHSTRIPVMGHADGLCAIYLNEAADGAKAQRVVLERQGAYLR